jgi:hypothetical protein
MGGEKKKAGTTGGKGKKEVVNSVPIQEYDFFVTRDGGKTEDNAPLDPSVKVKKKGGRNKSTSFFLSD